jgi:hypothetical protein
MNTLVSRSLLALMLFFVLGPAHAQSSQYNESDLAFITRINSQATEMYNKANKLDARLAAVDSKSDGKKKRNKARDELKAIKADIRNEQQRMDGKDFKKGQSKKEEEKRMQKLQDRLRKAEADVKALAP